MRITGRKQSQEHPWSYTRNFRAKDAATGPIDLAYPNRDSDRMAALRDAEAEAATYWKPDEESIEERYE